MKKLGIFASVIAVVLGGAWVFRAEILLELISYRMQGGPMEPNKEITWQSGTDASTGERPPNIILIVADDLGWNDLTINGGGVAGGTVPTPNINAIAEEGAFFRNGHSASGTCAPSRAALMSGRYPTRFGFEYTPTPPGMLKTVFRLGGGGSGDGPPTYLLENDEAPLPYEDMGMPTGEISLAETLKARGYHTAHIGKWHLGRTNGMAPHDQGFDESLLMSSGLYLPEDDPGVVNAKQDFDPIDRFLWKALRWAASFNGGADFEPGGYITDYYTDEAVKVIAANKDRPFFLYLAHWAPHTPLQATKEDYDALSHIELHRERVYAAMIRSLDRGIGQVTQALNDNGIEDNTVVIFTSDNGGAGYIGLPEINQPYRGWKITLFEGGIHVPYFIKWTGKIAPGTVSDVPVHHVDIYATAAAAAGAAMPEDREMDGVNLLPWAMAPSETSQVPEGNPHEALFWRQGHYQVVKTADWKFQRADHQDKVWLFSMVEDLTEQVNVAAENPVIVDQMHALLDAHNKEQLTPAWPAQIDSPQRIDHAGHEPWQEGEEYVYWPN
jgi:uncharacterized sulfatase